MTKEGITYHFPTQAHHTSNLSLTAGSVRLLTNTPVEAPDHSSMVNILDVYSYVQQEMHWFNGKENR